MESQPQNPEFGNNPETFPHVQILQPVKTLCYQHTQEGKGEQSSACLKIKLTRGCRFEPHQRHYVVSLSKK